MMDKKNNKIILFLLFLLNAVANSNGILDEKYYFQLYPSKNKDKPFLFHAYTPNSKLLTINSTEGENCQIVKDEEIDEYPIKNLSSVIIFNQTLLIKTCFGPDKIVEIIDEKNETFCHKNNNYDGSNKNLSNIKFCYSTTILNPILITQNIIITYWTEFTITNGKEKYIHKCILFNPKTKSFSSEQYLVGGSTLYERVINNNYYAKSCTTFRGIDIYCSINLEEKISIVNSFSIDTSKLFTSEPHMHLVLSDTNYGIDIYQKPIAIDKQVHDCIFGWLFDAFLTEYHNKEENKIMLVSSLFRKKIYTSFISVSDSSKKYYGINIEDNYIEPNLFNHLIPNINDLIIIYTMKTGNDTSLIMSRLNLTSSITYHKKFKEYALSNYLRYDICSNPK